VVPLISHLCFTIPDLQTPIKLSQFHSNPCTPKPSSNYHHQFHHLHQFISQSPPYQFLHFLQFQSPNLQQQYPNQIPANPQSPINFIIEKLLCPFHRTNLLPAFHRRRRAPLLLPAAILTRSCCSRCQLTAVSITTTAAPPSALIASSSPAQSVQLLTG
jgi:hypothetical protein